MGCARIAGLTARLIRGQRHGKARCVLSILYRHLLRPLLFLLDPETAHHVAMAFLRLAHRSRFARWLLRLLAGSGRPDSRLSVRALGREFASPLGMAAGFDKAGECYQALSALGFGFVEIGTVTALSQPGNPRPRLFRLPQDSALINRMGFNNPGAAAVARSVRCMPPDSLVLGINLGKSLATPLADAAADFALSARLLAPLADYLVINVSSPNTPGLRSLQAAEALRPLVAAVQQVLGELPAPPLLLVKLAPDLADDEVAAVAELALEMNLAGLIVSNTTIARSSLGLRTPAAEVERLGAGGLSGPPLRSRALAMIRLLYQVTGGKLTIIGVGGIETAEHAWAMILAGASLVQLYTGFVYGGPGVVSEIHRGLAVKLTASGFSCLEEAVGKQAADPKSETHFAFNHAKSGKFH